MSRGRGSNRWLKLGIPAALGAGVGAAGVALGRRVTGVRKGVSKLSDIGVGDLGDDLLAKVESLLASDGATRGGYRAARFDTAELEERRRERAARRRRRHQRTRT